jgi:AP-3 complex subunit delta-1
LFSKTLTDLVRSIRSYKSNPSGEAPFIHLSIQAIRKEVRSSTKEIKAMAVLKLAFLQMLGYDMAWAAPDVVEVMSYSKVGLKQ